MNDASGAARAQARAVEHLQAAGLTASLFVRDLQTHAEIGLNPEQAFPLASLVKVPLGVAVLMAAESGAIDLTAAITLRPADAVPGPTGLGKFRHPATIAVEDLLYLTFAISDDTATDALFQLLPPTDVNRAMDSLGIVGMSIRHPIADLYRSVAEHFTGQAFDVVHALVVESAETLRPSPIPQLNSDSSNSGSARSVVDLLDELWSEASAIPPSVRARVRELMATNIMRQRLWPEFTSHRMQWFSKTGSFLTLRHEAGVVEHESGRSFAVATLTRSSIPVLSQPAAEAAMGAASRELFDFLLQRSATD